jgi:3-keto-disaccharide hydrolase
MPIRSRTTLSALLGLTVALGALMQDEKRPGYTDTPRLPGQEYRVHDATRPYPRVVKPGTGTAAPSDARVLFDGRGLDAWQSGSKPAAWTAKDDWFEVKAGTGDLRTKESFGSCQLHLEWASPSAIQGSGQGRGNSGLFFLERYEIQILDTFENPTYADGQAAALYGQFPPMVNACRAPGAWQSYDVVFEAPRFEKSELISPARVTLFHNGVLVHHAREMLGLTAHRTLPSYRPHAAKAPIKLQDHGNPVRFRNIWLREL